ncbi:hypothetical protein N7478_011860 [Penicillium angulare]|uniref:uncharacterized protein n=1 Tax=Penicillium angulare TaxID=116970 RepID=UPI002542629A|nr:uncharacterized protein N7478_011860 [Penicillium angulare]KAJ5261265.1 hypothetical protein N7478_011860 [Penicillium angulare]
MDDETAAGALEELLRSYVAVLIVSYEAFQKISVLCSARLGLVATEAGNLLYLMASIKNVLQDWKDDQNNSESDSAPYV